MAFDMHTSAQTNTNIKITHKFSVIDAAKSGSIKNQNI